MCWNMPTCFSASLHGTFWNNCSTSLNFPKEELEKLIGGWFTSCNARDIPWTRLDERGNIFKVYKTLRQGSRNRQRILQFPWLSMVIEVGLKSISFHKHERIWSFHTVSASQLHTSVQQFSLATLDHPEVSIWFRKHPGHFLRQYQNQFPFCCTLWQHSNCREFSKTGTWPLYPDVLEEDILLRKRQ
jgi:hypothetical protein